MTLHIIGIGLSDEKDITLKGLEMVKKCEEVYLESYTSVLQCPVGKLEELYGKKIILADREMVEKNPESTILKNAKEKNIAFLVVGDALTATTHVDLILRAKKKEINVKVVFNASILGAVGVTGLELYKFGKTTSIVFPEKSFKPTSAYDVIKKNKENEMHTLCLLDIKADEKKYMTVNEAINILLDIEKEKKQNVFTEETFCIGCA
ncbi:diphthine synthase, partial [Candidatus Woesearchaeota archaeon]|nr:diphthine synthase [Candidatus Woesearchaeota archaeon]